MAHVGALRAAEERHVNFVGVAGTSIGAVVAALVSAGYSSNELFRVENGKVTGLLCFNLTDKISPTDYAAFKKLQAQIFGVKPSGEVARRLPIFRLLAAQAITYFRNRGVLDNIWLHFGAASTDEFRQWLNSAINEKLGRSSSTPVKFSDLTSIPLRVVATDLQAGSVRVFGGEKDANLSVADAVVASATFPFFFRPAIIGDQSLVDGGLISNLPAWVFDEERQQRSAPTPTFAFRLVDPILVSPPINGPLKHFPDFLTRLARTAIAGAPALEYRGVSDYYAVDLVTDIETLAFDQTLSKAPVLVESGLQCVRTFFRQELGPRDPATMQEVLSSVSRAISACIREASAPIDPPRVSLAILNDREKVARVLYSSVRGAHLGLRLSPTSPGAGLSISLREPVAIYPRDLDGSVIDDLQTSLEHAVRRESVGVVQSIPIFRDHVDWSFDDPARRQMPLGTLIVEFEGDIRAVLSRSDIEDRLANFAQVLGEYLLDLDLGTLTQQRASVVEFSFSDTHLINGINGLVASSRKARHLPQDDEITDLADNIRLAARRVRSNSTGL